MFPARRFAAVVTALLLIAGAFFALLFSAADAQAQGSSGTCEDAAELAVLPSPIAPWKGAPLRVVFAAEKPLEGELSLIAPDGSVAAKSRERHGGPPYFWFAEVASPAAGKWHAKLARDHAPAECSMITREIAVRDASRRGRTRPREASGRCAIHGIARRKTCIRHGSRSSSTRRSRRRCRGRRCMRCCAIDRAISCSTIWGWAKTRWGSSFAPTVPTFHTSCARISPSRWGCRSGTRSARAAARGQPPRCHAWWNIQNPEAPAPAARTNHCVRAPTSRPIPIGDASPAGRASSDRACAEPTAAAGHRSRWGLRRRSATICADRRRRRPFRIRANARRATTTPIIYPVR